MKTINEIMDMLKGLENFADITYSKFRKPVICITPNYDNNTKKINSFEFILEKECDEKNLTFGASYYIFNPKTKHEFKILWILN